MLAGSEVKVSAQFMFNQKIDKGNISHSRGLFQ